MPGYNNQYNNELQSGHNNRLFFNKMFRKLSNWGMDIDSMIIQNTQAVGINEDPNTAMQDYNTNMYDIFTKKVISRILDRKSIAYLDRAYQDKRKILKQYAIKDEISDFLTQISDETIIYDDNNYFCQVGDLPDKFDETIKQRYQENFNKIYINMGFNDGITAWNYLKTFLTDGYISFEIVYDNKQKNIIDLVPIDPLTLVVATDPGTGTVVWIQYPDNPQARRVLLDIQIVYIAYSTNNEYSVTSYVEGLIRPYNQLKMVEQTRLLYNINQAAIYKKFVIPVNGLTKAQAEQQIFELMSDYHEDISVDEVMGTISINGSSVIPHSKDFWFPEGEMGTPSMEILSSNGTDLNEDTMLNWFFKKLKRASKLPPSRFDEDSGGGSLFSDASEVTRDEIKFNSYIKRLRTLFKEIIVKPLKTQMILDFPELQYDNLFMQSIQIKFNSNELFEEWKYLNNISKRAEIASTLNSNLQDVEGNPFLHIMFIMKNIMKFTDEQLAENERYKLGSSTTEKNNEGSESENGGNEISENEKNENEGGENEEIKEF